MPGKENSEKKDYQHRIRHDFRNKIQIIQGSLELLEDMDISKEAKEFVEKALKATENSHELLEKWRQKEKEG